MNNLRIYIVNISQLTLYPVSVLVYVDLFVSSLEARTVLLIVKSLAPRSVTDIQLALNVYFLNESV